MPSILLNRDARREEHEQQRLLRMQAVFGLIEDDRGFRFEYLGRNFLAAVRRKTVHEERARTRERHQFFVHLIRREHCRALRRLFRRLGSRGCGRRRCRRSGVKFGGRACCVLREGKDISIFTCGHMVWRGLEAAEMLEREDGVEAEVVNVSIIKPIDSQAGHIPGARSAPFAGNLREDGSMKSADELRDRYLALGADAAAQIICYCGSGVTAAHDIFALHLVGRTDALLYEGSWSDWSSDPARPVATGPEPVGEDIAER